MGGFATSVADQTEMIHHLLIIREHKLLVHGRRNSRSFLGIHEEPHIFQFSFRLIIRQLIGEAISALTKVLHSCCRVECSAGFLSFEKLNIIVGKSIQHGSEAFLIINHCHVHVIHVHDMNDVLHGSTVGCVGNTLDRKDIAENILRLSNTLLRPVFPHGIW